MREKEEQGRKEEWEIKEIKNEKKKLSPSRQLESLKNE